MNEAPVRLPRPPIGEGVVTLTLSPCLDISSQVDHVEPSRKLRCSDDRMDAGGGGVNVARVVTELGGDALAVVAYLLSAVAVRSLTRSSDGVPASALGLTGVAKSDVSSSGGEVSLDGPGEIERRLAWSDAPIAEGARIRVIEHAGTRVKVVNDD